MFLVGSAVIDVCVCECFVGNCFSKRKIFFLLLRFFPVNYHVFRDT